MPQFQSDGKDTPFFNTAIGGAPKTPSKNEKVTRPKLGSGKRFAALAESLKKKGAKDPEALSAWIGREKYGKEKFQNLAARGRKAA